MPPRRRWVPKVEIRLRRHQGAGRTMLSLRQTFKRSRPTAAPPAGSAEKARSFRPALGRLSRVGNALQRAVSPSFPVLLQVSQEPMAVMAMGSD